MDEKMINALELFSKDIYKILEVDLANDSYTIIKSDQREEQQNFPRMTDWITYFAKTGQVYINDIEMYKHYTDLPALRTYFQHNNTKRWRIRYRRKFKKEYRWVVLDIIPAKNYDENNEIVYLFVQDDHQKKESEKNNVELIDQLREQMTTNDLVRSMLELGTWATHYDQNGKETEIRYSENFKKLLGFDDHDSFPDVLESWVDRIHPDDVERVLNLSKNSVEDYTNNTKFDVEYRMQKKDGSYHWFKSRGEYFRWSDGMPYFFTGICSENIHHQEDE